MKVLNPEWNDALRNSLYPFVGQDELRTDTGFEVPRDLFLDLCIMAPMQATTATLVSLFVPGLGVPVVATFAVDGTVIGTCELANTDNVILTATGERVGFVRVDHVTSTRVRGWPAGTHVVNRDVLPHLMVATPARAQRGIRLPDGTVKTGDVYLIGGPGVWVDLGPDNSVQISVVGDPYTGRVDPARSIRTINGVTAENFQISAEAAQAGQPTYRVKVEPTAAGIRLSLVGTVTS